MTAAWPGSRALFGKGLCAKANHEGGIGAGSGKADGRLFDPRKIVPDRITFEVTRLVQTSFRCIDTGLHHR